MARKLTLWRKIVLPCFLLMHSFTALMQLYPIKCVVYASNEETNFLSFTEFKICDLNSRLSSTHNRRQIHRLQRVYKAINLTSLNLFGPNMPNN